VNAWPVRLAALALVAALTADVFMLFGPMVREVNCKARSPSSSGSQAECTSEPKSLLEDNEDNTLVLLATVPLAFTGIGLPWAIHPPSVKALRWIFAGVFLFLCLLTGFTIGFLFLPAALLGLVVVAIDNRSATAAAQSR